MGEKPLASKKAETIGSEGEGPRRSDPALGNGWRWSSIRLSANDSMPSSCPYHLRSASPAVLAGSKVYQAFVPSVVPSPCRRVLPLAFAAMVELRGTLANSLVVEFVIWKELVGVSSESRRQDWPGMFGLYRVITRMKGWATMGCTELLVPPPQGVKPRTVGSSQSANLQVNNLSSMGIIAS